MKTAIEYEMIDPKYEAKNGPTDIFGRSLKAPAPPAGESSSAPTEAPKPTSYNYTGSGRFAGSDQPKTPTSSAASPKPFLTPVAKNKAPAATGTFGQGTSKPSTWSPSVRPTVSKAQSATQDAMSAVRNAGSYAKLPSRQRYDSLVSSPSVDSATESSLQRGSSGDPFAVQPAVGPQRGKIVGNAAQAARNGNSWAQYGQNGPDLNDPRMASMTGAGTGPQQPQQAGQQAQPKKSWWNSMDQDARKKMIADNGMTVKDFNGLNQQERSQLLKNWQDANGQQPQQASAPKLQQPTVQQPAYPKPGPSANPRRAVAAQNEPAAPGRASQRGPSDMVSYKGSMIDRASYDRIMANKANEITPERAQANLNNVRGLGFRAAYDEQEKRYARTMGRQPRDANGNLQTISLAGTPQGPYSSRSGVRGIPRPVGG